MRVYFNADKYYSSTDDFIIGLTPALYFCRDNSPYTDKYRLGISLFIFQVELVIIAAHKFTGK